MGAPKQLSFGLMADLLAKKEKLIMNTNPIILPDDAFLTRHSRNHRARLFKYEGEFYRTVVPEYLTLYQRMEEQGVIQRLVELGLLVETRPSDKTFAGHEKVYWHRTIPNVTHPCEWSFEAIRDAGIMLLKLFLELETYGLTLIDAHGWNIVFDGAKPYFVDMDSITEIDNDMRMWAFYEGFTQFFERPLRMHKQGHGSIARACLFRVESVISSSEFKPYRTLSSRTGELREAIPYYAAAAISKLKGIKPADRPARRAHWRRWANRSIAWMQSLDFSTMKTLWGDYYDKEFPSLDAKDTWTPKHLAVDEILTTLKPQTVHDVAGNRGWYSMLALRHGAVSAISSDTDDVSINDLQRRSSQENLPIKSVYMSITNPLSASGITYSNGHREFGAAVDRLKADMVLALAITHHLIFFRGLDFELIFKQFNQFTKKHLIIEFVDRNDQYVSQWSKNGFEWYTLENFVACANKYYSSVRVVDSHPKHRYILICSDMK